MNCKPQALICNTCLVASLFLTTLCQGSGYYLGPLNSESDDIVQHMAYEMDLEDCSTCHEKVNPKDPGPLTSPVNEGCFECHGEVEEELSASVVHAPLLDKCTNCHNPHESKHPSLLVDNIKSLCLDCHTELHAEIESMPVKHGVMDDERSCLNCHNPHASEIEYLLNKLPFNLCIECHSSDEIVDHDGIKLTNFGKMLDENEQWHAPVAAQDCSACHQPHGSNHFRLLVQEYPEQFYSPYDSELYALCFECHDDQIIANKETTKHTQFRDGNLNLHYLHVNKSSRGRTCRACHKVHASGQSHHIREGVPYGSGGWVLKLNYEQTETGGLCARTCHKEKSYDNTTQVRSIQTE